MIKACDVTKHFEDFKALSNLSMHVRKGTIYGLIGPNGAGNTTIINHLNGVLKPEFGTVSIGGDKVYENEKVKEKILTIADDLFYYSTYTVKQMANFYKDIYPLFSYERYEKLKNIFLYC